ncbi:MAG: hypothetical protein ABW176_17235 [Candidatus Thiodiazotropha endolucinida]
MSSANQLERFRSMLDKGDRVITYDSGNRIYHVGNISGDYQYNPDLMAPFVNTRNVEWSGSVERDALSIYARNTLGLC